MVMIFLVIDKGAFPLPRKKFKFMDNLYCEVCNIELTSETVMQSHISGMRHLKVRGTCAYTIHGL